VLGRAVAAEAVADTLKKLLETYVEIRLNGERFIDTVRRVGVAPFKEAVYAVAS